MSSESSISSVGPEEASTHRARVHQSNTQPWSRGLWIKQMRRPRAWLTWPLFLAAVASLLAVIIWSGVLIGKMKDQAKLCKEYSTIRQSKNITDDDLIRYHRKPSLSSLSGKNYVLDEVENVPCPVWNRRFLVYGGVLTASSVQCFFVLLMLAFLHDRRVIRFQGRRQPIDDLKNPSPDGCELANLAPKIKKKKESVLINMPPPKPIEGIIFGQNSSKKIRDWLEKRLEDPKATAENLAPENRGSVDWHSLPRNAKNPTQNSTDDWPLRNPTTEAGPSGSQPNFTGKDKGKAKATESETPSSDPQPRWKPGYMITDYNDLITSTISRILHERRAKFPDPPTREALIAKLHELDERQSRLANMGPLGPPLEEKSNGKKASKVPLFIARGTEAVELDGVEVQVAQVGRMSASSENSRLKPFKLSSKKEANEGSNASSSTHRNTEAAEPNVVESQVGQAITKPSSHYTWPRMPKISLEEVPTPGGIGARPMLLDAWKKMRDSEDAKENGTSSEKEAEGEAPLAKVISWGPGDDECLVGFKPGDDKKAGETGDGKGETLKQDGRADSGKGRGKDKDGQAGNGKEDGQVGNEKVKGT